MVGNETGNPVTVALLGARRKLRLRNRVPIFGNHAAGCRTDPDLDSVRASEPNAAQATLKGSMPETLVEAWARS